MPYNIKQGLKKIKQKIKELKRTKKIIIIGVAGSSASGKTTIAKQISKNIINMDDYYIGRNKMIDENYDHPRAQDLNLLKKHLKLLKQNKSINKPIYNFKTHSRVGYKIFKPSSVIVIDGLFALNQKLSNEVDIKVFVDAPEKTRLKRRIQRDTKERGRTKTNVIKQWLTTVQPMYKKFVLPTKKNAIVIKT